MHFCSAGKGRGKETIKCRTGRGKWVEIPFVSLRRIPHPSALRCMVESNFLFMFIEASWLFVTPPRVKSPTVGAFFYIFLLYVDSRPSPTNQPSHRTSSLWMTLMQCCKFFCLFVLFWFVCKVWGCFVMWTQTHRGHRCPSVMFEQQQQHHHDIRQRIIIDHRKSANVINLFSPNMV